jgi:hypothetical protein
VTQKVQVLLLASCTLSLHLILLTLHLDLLALYLKLLSLELVLSLQIQQLYPEPVSAGEAPVAPVPGSVSQE